MTTDERFRAKLPPQEAQRDPQEAQTRPPDPQETPQEGFYKIVFFSNLLGGLSGGSGGLLGGSGGQFGLTCLSIRLHGVFLSHPDSCSGQFCSILSKFSHASIHFLNFSQFWVPGVAGLVIESLSL